MFKYIFLFFFIYFAYRFIFRFVLPLLRATSAMKQQVNQMNNARKQYENQNQTSTANAYVNSPQQQKPERLKEKEGEYIDFEEMP